MATTTSNIMVGTKNQSGVHNVALTGTTSDVAITIDTTRITTKAQLMAAAKAAADHLSLL